MSPQSGDGTSLPLVAPLKQALVDDWRVRAGRRHTAGSEPVPHTHACKLRRFPHLPARCQRVTQKGQVASLPCEPCVTTILEEFVAKKREEAGEDREQQRVWEEVVAGVQLYFDKSLASHLLCVRRRAVAGCTALCGVTHRLCLCVQVSL